MWKHRIIKYVEYVNRKFFVHSSAIGIINIVKQFAPVILT